MAQDRRAPAQALRAERVDTIAAIATPPGEGALGIVRAAGPDAARLASELTGRVELPPRQAVRVTVSDARGAIDDCVALFFPAAASPLGEDLVEFTCHGSPYILKRVLERLYALGARPARAGEFTQRAFLNGRLDLAQAESVCDLIKADDAASHRAALQALGGGLSTTVRRLQEPVFDLLVRVEACLDHPEEDIESLTPEAATAALAAARAPIEALAASHESARPSDGARLALVGRPNAGKSSLLNALLGRDRAIVSAAPGTTRDTLEERAEVAGAAAVLVDTAGLRARCADEAEREGVARAERALESCDVAVLVVDGSRAPDAEDAATYAKVLETAARRGTPVVAALNKADLGLAADVQGGVAVSAKSGAGLEALRAAIAGRLGGRREGALSVNARHARALRDAARELSLAEAAVGELGRAWEDRAACHLRECLRALGSILGDGAPDEALHAVFSRFCVGK